MRRNDAEGAASSRCRAPAGSATAPTLTRGAGVSSDLGGLATDTVL